MNARLADGQLFKEQMWAFRNAVESLTLDLQQRLEACTGAFFGHVRRTLATARAVDVATEAPIDPQLRQRLRAWLDAMERTLAEVKVPRSAEADRAHRRSGIV